MARTYTKRNQEYWTRHNSAAQKQSQIVVQTAPQAPAIEGVPFPEVTYGSIGESTALERGGQINQPGAAPDAFQNLRSMGLPYVGFNGTRDAYSGMTDTIDLCARAWAGVPPARNAIEVSVEFSNQPLHIKCKNKTVKKFFEEWFRAIRINKLKEQFFREYYRSGNVFLMTFEGKFGPTYYKNFQNSFGAKDNRVPIRYEILNPMNVFVPVGLTTPYTYVRLLSTYEINRLKNPLTEQDKQVYNSLPQDVKDQIQAYGSSPMGIYIPLEPKRLRFAFYKKQPYEPLAVPMIWPVLPDIEWKLMLKKQDKALVQNVERILLLVTTGEAPSQWNGQKGINQNNITNLQNLLRNQTLNRVLVADYSTKAQFIQPDLTALDAKKYEQVNRDIEEGLQSIMSGGGNDKFANAQVKVKIFIQRLEEGQQSFIDDFLDIEIENVCEAMGFRDKPEVRFRKIKLQDETVMARVYAQLAQLGILTGAQTINALETDVLPDKDEMDSAQTEYVKDRDDGKYLPLVGGTQKEDGEGAVGGGGRPPGKGTKQSTKSVGPIGTSKGEESQPQFSMKTMIAAVRERSNLEAAIEKELKRKFKLTEMTAEQLDIVASLSFAVMANYPMTEWIKRVKGSIKEPPAVSAAISEELDDLREQYGLHDVFEAVMVKHSKLAGK